MQFSHPNYFFFLIALLIPILVHLFQLRKFKVQNFTNLAVLETIKLQTRQSKTLKKWLILSLRLLAITSLVVAFTQPYFSNFNSKNENPEIVIYLDNSFSMQARGTKGPLLNQAVQSLLSERIPLENITVFTNTKTYPNRSIKDLKSELLDIEYTDQQLSITALFAKASSLFTKNKTDQKYLLLISDFQKKNSFELNTDFKFQTFIISLRPVVPNNGFIEALSVKSKISDYELKVVGKTVNESQDSLNLSLFNGKKLIGKSVLLKSKKFITTFSIPKDEPFKGRFVLDDLGLTYDDVFYFNIDKSAKTSVLAIGEENRGYLSRIFTKETFLYNFTTVKGLNYKFLQQQDLIIISELKRLPNVLINNLKSFVKNGGSLIIIPTVNGDIGSYNTFLETESLNFKTLISHEKKITYINFDHPIFKEAFERSVRNFQYPKIRQHYEISSGFKTLLKFEDNKPFLVQKQNLFVFTAPIGSENSNFTESPLIVPTMYGMGKSSLKIPKLFYTLGEKNELSLRLNFKNESVLKLSRDKKSFIPLQSKQNSKLKLFFDNIPKKAGHYALHKESDTLQYLSFNYDRKESLLQYHNIDNLKDFNVLDSVSKALESVKSEVNINELWKWFVIFALIFLAIEILVLKFFE